jgi:hypothetical protein
MAKPFLFASTLASAIALLPAVSLADRQAWQVHRQTGPYGEAIAMSAYADADSGPGRMDLYCDNRDGFRVIFSPHRLAMTAGSGHVVLTIDANAPVTLVANAFGDDAKDTDVVTVYDTARIETALSTAGHVAVKFIGYDNSTSESAFTFEGMAAEKDTLLKVCPIAR